MDGIIAIALPAWVVWIVVTLLCVVIFLDAWKIRLLLQERKERRARLALRSNSLHELRRLQVIL
jgi:hypothetical protein